MDALLGAQLKRAREARGIPLRQIAVRTKISMTALEAMERNDFSRLPGGIFGRSFIKAYAMEVGLDPDATVVSFVDVLQRYEREAAERGAIRPEITPDDRRFLERQRRAVLALQITVAVVVLSLLALLTWQLHAYFTDRPAAEDQTPSSLGMRSDRTGSIVVFSAD
jgi:cytoskeletal protein RodZ